jgi:hypothetical protein
MGTEACRYCGTVPNPSTPEVCTDDIEARNCALITNFPKIATRKDLTRIQAEELVDQLIEDVIAWQRNTSRRSYVLDYQESRQKVIDTISAQPE